MRKNIAITGAGLVSSLGLTVTETWEAILAGRQGINPGIGLSDDDTYAPMVAQVNNLNASDLGIHPRDSRIMDKHAYMLMKSSRDAFAQAQLDSDSLLPDDIGFFAGMGMVDYKTDDLLPAVVDALDENKHIDYDQFFSKAYEKIHPLWPLSMLNNISFCQVAIDLGIKGENSVFSPHSDSGIHAVIEGYSTLTDGKATAVLAGGVSEKISSFSLARAAGFGMLHMSSIHNTRCRPFCKERKGTSLGEGAGIIVMELYDDAKKRGVPVLAKITGYGTSFDKMRGVNCPTKEAISDAMDEALKHACLTSQDIDVVIAHGEGTLHADRNEMLALKDIFKDSIHGLRVYSSKSVLGHMLAGSSPVDIILGIQILNHGIIPANSGMKDPDSDVMFHVIPGTHEKADVKRILINSQSYEGQCASLILERPD